MGVIKLMTISSHKIDVTNYVCTCRIANNIINYTDYYLGMKHIIPHLFIAALTSMFAISFTAKADDTSVIIRVIDQSGNSVPEAVVTLTSDGVMPALDNVSKAVMAQRNVTFEPHILAIPKGTEVWFPNEDDFRHHIYSFSKAQQFEIRLYGGDEEKRITFDTAGVVALGCNIHDSMLAYIYVADTPYVRKANENGRIEFLSVIPNDYSVTVWHPRMKNDKSDTGTMITVSQGKAAEQEISLILKRERKKTHKKRY